MSQGIKSTNERTLSERQTIKRNNTEILELKNELERWERADHMEDRIGGSKIEI